MRFRRRKCAQSAPRPPSVSTSEWSRRRTAISRCALASGSFRQDLYARLALWQLEVPALRERRADILAWIERLHRAMGGRARHRGAGAALRRGRRRDAAALRVAGEPARAQSLRARDRDRRASRSDPPRRPSDLGARGREPMSDRYLLLRGKSTALRIAAAFVRRVAHRARWQQRPRDRRTRSRAAARRASLRRDARSPGPRRRGPGRGSEERRRCPPETRATSRSRTGCASAAWRWSYGRSSRRRTDSAYAAGEDGAVVAESAAMRAVIESAEALAATPGSVLILGETGAGKDVVAQLIHDRSNRSGAPLYQEELRRPLGPRRRGRPGERRDGPPRRGRRPVCRARSSPSATCLERDPDVRFVFTSNHDLEEDVKAGKLRKDLYFRINRARIVVPPLREHLEDIAPLAAALRRPRRRLRWAGTQHRR